MPALCIIDMQSDFIFSSCGCGVCGISCEKSRKILSNTLRRIKFFKRHQYPILIVDYIRCGNVHEDITNAARGYKGAYFIHKNACDGGKDIINCLSNNNIKISDMLVCGVYTCQCVQETAMTLAKNNINIKIAKSAVACNCVGGSEVCVEKLLNDVRAIELWRNKFKETNIASEGGRKL